LQIYFADQPHDLGLSFRRSLVPINRRIRMALSNLSSISCCFLAFTITLPAFASCQQTHQATSAHTSTDAQSTPCQAPAREEVTKEDVVTMLKSELTDTAIEFTLKARVHPPFSSKEIASFANERKAKTNVAMSENLTKELTRGADVYIAWSVLPGKVVRDNFGHFVLGSYLALDVVIANRSSDVGHSVLVSALEFCHNRLRDVSVDPKMVKGTLNKGEMTGARTMASNSISAIGAVLTPAAPFFKNMAHRLNFETGLSFFSPAQTAFDKVFPNTINRLYLIAWGQEEVFTQGGFVVPSGAERRGRVFIPIEHIYPRPEKDHPCKGSKDQTSCKAGNEYKAWEQRKKNWNDARSGSYKPEEVKKAIGSLVVLGQAVTVGSPVRVISTAQ
jgi:hypothetical protein